MCGITGVDGAKRRTNKRYSFGSIYHLDRTASSPSLKGINEVESAKLPRPHLGGKQKSNKNNNNNSPSSIRHTRGYTSPTP